MSGELFKIAAAQQADIVDLCLISINGRPRYVSVTLPFVSCLADQPSYQPPPPVAPRERAPRMTDAYVRRALGRDRQQAKRALDRVGYEHIMRRIQRDGF